MVVTGTVVVTGATVVVGGGVTVVVEVVVVDVVVEVVLVVVEVVVGGKVVVVVEVEVLTGIGSFEMGCPQSIFGLSFTQLFCPSVMRVWFLPRDTGTLRCSHGLFAVAGQDFPSLTGTPICGFSLMREVRPSEMTVCRLPIMPGICTSGAESHGPGFGTASFIGIPHATPG